MLDRLGKIEANFAVTNLAKFEMTKMVANKGSFHTFDLMIFLKLIKIF